MATRQDKLQMLTRYYTPTTAANLMRGRLGAAPNTVSWRSMDAYAGRRLGDAAIMARLSLRHTRGKALAARKRGEHIEYTTHIYSQLCEYAAYNPLTPAFASDWNRLLGQEVIAHDLWDRAMLILPPPEQRDHLGFVRAIGFRNNVPRTDDNVISSWTRRRTTELLEMSDGARIYARAPGHYSGECFVTRYYEDEVLIENTNIPPVLLRHAGFKVFTLGDLVQTGPETDDAFWDVQDGPARLIGAERMIAVDPFDPEALEVATRYAERRTRSSSTSRIQIQGRHTSAAFLQGVDATQPGEWNLGLEWETAVQHDDRAVQYLHDNPRAASHIGDVNAPRQVSVLQTVCAFRRASGVNSYVHPEHDGTIPEGYELVFGYRSLSEHKRLFAAALEVDKQHPWVDTMKKSYQAGIHVHIGRATHDRTMTNQQITALANIVHWRENREFINAIARRNIGATSYIHIPATRSRDGRVGLSNGNCSSKLRSHYAPVNVRQQTVELRIFASGDFNEALEALEWGEALACYAVHMCDGRALAHTAKARLHWARVVEYVRANEERWPYASARTYTADVAQLLAIYTQTQVEEATQRDELRRARLAQRHAASVPAIAPPTALDSDDAEGTRVYLDSAVSELMQA